MSCLQKLVNTPDILWIEGYIEQNLINTVSELSRMWWRQIATSFKNMNKEINLLLD